MPMINIEKWIAANRDKLKPPVANKVLLENDQVLVMIVAGPNARYDYHYNETSEYFYQLEGELHLKIQENGKAKTMVLGAGDMYLLNPKVPHCPIRKPNSLGIVVEFKREDMHQDGLLWFCQECNTKLYESYFKLENIEKDFLARFNEFYNSEEHRRCPQCNALHPKPQ